MKYYLFFLFSFLLVVSSFANVNNNLVVFSNDGEKFILILNGQRYNETPSTTVKATSLNLKTYQVRIIFENTRLKDLNTNLYFYRTNKECVFGLNKKGNRKFTMDYVSETDIIETTVDQNQTINNNTNNSNGNAVPTNSTPPTNSKENNSIQIKTGNVNIGVNENGGISLGGNNGNVNLNKNDKSGKISIGNDAIVLNKVAKTGCTNPMAPLDFEVFQKKVSSQTSDTTKLETAKVLLDGACLKTSQVKEVMQSFKHDETKLEFAKNAYSHTNDLNNYYQLKSQFEGEAKKDEFQKFLRESK